jgi:hypothetical protein
MQNKNADIAVCRECDEKLSSRLAVIFQNAFFFGIARISRCDKDSALQNQPSASPATTFRGSETSSGHGNILERGIFLDLRCMASSGKRIRNLIAS